jgi:hypothetical protein
MEEVDVLSLAETATIKDASEDKSFAVVGLLTAQPHPGEQASWGLCV